MEPIKVGLIGFGRMGGFYLDEIKKSNRWKIAGICDTDPVALDLAKKAAPEAIVVNDENTILYDPEIKVVILSALANSRLAQIEKAAHNGKHIISEKPIADTTANEWEAVYKTELSDRFATVNLYLRNAWYHKTLREFIDSGEIGQLAIIRVCHLTPGLAPGEGHEAEGPSFHDCGMHYVDIARWYAGAEFKTWHAQALRMWSYKDPWWLQVHGTFDNGVIFDITQGHVYGQLSRDQTHNSYIDIIGTKGIARMTHDFKNATVELHGTDHTLHIRKPYGGKNIGQLCDLMASSIESGVRQPGMPTMRDAAIASEYAWKFLEDARLHHMPAIGTLDELAQIHLRRSSMKNGYGLLRNPSCRLS